MKKHGGDIIGDFLGSKGVKQLYTLCGGHISPILTGAKNVGIEIVDVRDEVSAVFAADASSRMTGIPGVAAVTAGPGVTNTITAIKNAQMAQSPLILLGGATATILKGRGSLQDIDQMALMEPVTKWSVRVTKIKSLIPTLEKAFEVATLGVPGPVFVEVPVDILYPEATVKDWYMKEAGLEKATGLGAKALKLYLKAHLKRQFHQPHIAVDISPPQPFNSLFDTTIKSAVKDTIRALKKAKRPVLIVGSQALVNYSKSEANELSECIESIAIPTFLGGGARGLLGQKNEIQFRHKRSAALKKADLVIVAGFPFDFRLGYGQKINKKATVVSVNLNEDDLKKNRKPTLALLGHSGDFLVKLSHCLDGATQDREPWFNTLRDREKQRDDEIEALAKSKSELINPVGLFSEIEKQMDENSVIVVDGGDFVATGSYIVRPRRPLQWLDPGVFGTLGVGGGFAIGAAKCRPDAEIWLFYGDGSSAYSLAEFDTYVRHGLAPIAVVGTDAEWAQIAREQKQVLRDDVGTTLLRTDYHIVAKGFGGEGLLLKDPKKMASVIKKAKKLATEGKPVLINAHLEKNDFREGSISI